MIKPEIGRYYTENENLNDRNWLLESTKLSSRGCFSDDHIKPDRIEDVGQDIHHIMEVPKRLTQFHPLKDHHKKSREVVEENGKYKPHPWF